LATAVLGRAGAVRAGFLGAAGDLFWDMGGGRSGRLPAGLFLDVVSDQAVIQPLDLARRAAPSCLFDPGWAAVPRGWSYRLDDGPGPPRQRKSPARFLGGALGALTISDW